MPQDLKAHRRCMCCEVSDGLRTANGKGHSYYVSSRNGRRMLVVKRRLGERLRINRTTDVVILDIGSNMVKLGVERAADKIVKPR